MTRLLATVLLLVSTLGCTNDARYTVWLVPPAGDEMAGAAAVDLTVLRQDCTQRVWSDPPENWLIVARQQWHVGTQPPTLGEIDRGRWGMMARIRDASCVVRWAGCTFAALEYGGEGTIRIPLVAAPTNPGCIPEEVCDAQGGCGPRPPCDNVTVACDGDGDGSVFCLEGQAPPACDCADEDPAVHPGAEEHCDGIDNDCDGDEDPAECADCFDRCPDLSVCERPSCPDGPAGECIAEHRPDGYDCDGEEGTVVCCHGECDGACTPGDTDTRGCGQCGVQERLCGEDCQWGTFGTCDESGDSECSPDDEQDLPCGNCGTQHEICGETCLWEPDGACVGQGVCAVGTDRAPAVCGNCGQRIDTCDADCTWQLGSCEPDPDLLDTCTDPEVCCPNGWCGEDGAECCGTDTSTCGAEPLCQDWTCVTGTCTAVDETAGDDPEDECSGADCCDGDGQCTAVGCD